jgi:hypothetical protein
MNAHSLPPVTVEEVQRAIDDPSFSVYVYVGKASDRGWKVADFAFGLLARLRIYRAVSHGNLDPAWLDARRSNGAKPRGIVFGWDAVVDRYLDKAETESLEVVLKAIRDAR